MIILDRMLVGTIQFVLGKLVAAAEAELNDDGALREELLAAQMRLELGEMTTEEFNDLEGRILARLKEIRERQRGATGALGADGGEFEIAGAEATFLGGHGQGGGA